MRAARAPRPRPDRPDPSAAAAGRSPCLRSLAQLLAGACRGTIPGAGVPIVPGALDFANRRVVIGAPFQPTGDAEADLQALLAFFRPYVPKKPEYVFYGD